MKNDLCKIILTHIEEIFVSQFAKVNDAYHNGCVVRMRVPLAAYRHTYLKQLPFYFMHE